MSEIKTKPRFDGLEAVTEILEWAGEPTEVKERVERLKEAMAKSLHFNLFVRQVAQQEFTFLEVSEGGVDYKPTHLDRWLCAHNGSSWLELPRYADDSSVPMPRRRNQLVQLLDHVWAPEAEVMKDLINGVYKLPDRVNHKVLSIALGEDLSQPA